ncbi:MAG: DNA-3-methyladenine glycosylase [Clostridiales bacterium]|nr:DNA-3-methyladenine glycosylase [Clostridiales bacterium]
MTNPKKIIPTTFFRKDALEIAPYLLGCTICKQSADGQIKRGIVMETEVYRGEEDLDCHARKGKTKRNAPLYEQGGIGYVYLIYGIHWLFNVVTGEKDHPQGVLIRALMPPLDGPGKWTKAFEITGENNEELLVPEKGLWFEEGIKPLDYQTAPRVGIHYAPALWREKPWRFIYKKEP